MATQPDLRLKPWRLLGKEVVSPPREIMKMIDEGRITCVFCMSATFMAFRELGLLTIKE